MSNLFTAASNIGPKPLVSFRAGKMYLEGRLVKPDTRKGTINLSQGDDGLMHFTWKDRFSGQTEEDLVIFPSEAVFKKVDKCTTGRVYVLDFHGSRQLFFWIQEPKTDKDEENCNKINQLLNNPPTPGSAPAAARTGGQPATRMDQLDRNQLLGILAGLQGQQQQQQQQQAARPATAAAATAAPAANRAAPAPGLADTLQSILAGLGGPVQIPQQTQPAQSLPLLRPPELNLQHVVEASDVHPVLNSQISKEFTETLLSHLPPIPEGVSPQQHLIENIRSSQFRQTVSLFQSALEDPQAFNEIVNAFELKMPPSSGPSLRFGVQAFLDAIAFTYPAKQESTQSPDNGAKPMEE